MCVCVQYVHMCATSFFRTEHHVFLRPWFPFPADMMHSDYPMVNPWVCVDLGREALVIGAAHHVCHNGQLRRGSISAPYLPIIARENGRPEDTGIIGGYIQLFWGSRASTFDFQYSKRKE